MSEWERVTTVWHKVCAYGSLDDWLSCHPPEPVAGDQREYLVRCESHQGEVSFDVARWTGQQDGWHLNSDFNQNGNVTHWAEIPRVN